MSDELHEGEPLQTQLFGRDDELSALRADTHRVVVITGDTGTGKSALLEAARALDEQLPDGERPLLPPAVALLRSPGSLQRALLRSLGEAVSVLATNESVAKTIVQNLAASAEKLAKLQGTDIAKAVAKVALSFVRGRAGDLALIFHGNG